MKSLYIQLISYDSQKGERWGSIVGLLSSSIFSNVDTFKNIDKQKIKDDLSKNLSQISHKIESVLVSQKQETWHIWSLEWKMKDLDYYQKLLEQKLIPMRTAKISFLDSKNFPEIWPQKLNKNLDELEDLDVEDYEDDEENLDYDEYEDEEEDNQDDRKSNLQNGQSNNGGYQHQQQQHQQQNNHQYGGYHGGNYNYNNNNYYEEDGIRKIQQNCDKVKKSINFFQRGENQQINQIDQLQRKINQLAQSQLNQNNLQKNQQEENQNEASDTQSNQNISLNQMIKWNQILQNNTPIILNEIKYLDGVQINFSSDEEEFLTNYKNKKNKVNNYTLNQENQKAKLNQNQNKNPQKKNFFEFKQFFSFEPENIITNVNDEQELQKTLETLQLKKQILESENQELRKSILSNKNQNDVKFKKIQSLTQTVLKLQN